MTAWSQRGNGAAGPGAAANGNSPDLAVVGAGILGLAVAREALLRHPGLRVRIFEKEPQIAAHQTGHNSGVIHAGVYYLPGSLKARLCVEGARELYAYCDENGIPYERCGKVVVATSDEEVPRLEELRRRATRERRPRHRDARRGRTRGTGAERRGSPRPVFARDGDRRLPPRRAGAGRGRDASVGGEIITGANVVELRPGRPTELRTPAGAFRAKTIITCAGAYSDRLARMTGAPEAPKIVPFRGRYYSLRPSARGLVRGLVYPVPDPEFPFLGVHFTKQISGDVWTGPNAVLAFSREGYRWRDVDAADALARPWRTGASGRWRGRTGARAQKSYAAISRSAHSRRRCSASSRRCGRQDLTDSHAGVRAQALTDDGRLLDDFWFDHAENVVHVRNAPSPGATSSLALAREIVGAAEESIARA